MPFLCQIRGVYVSETIFSHLIKNIDLYITVGLGIALAILSVFYNILSNYLINGILLTISLLAFSLLRARIAIQKLDKTANDLLEKQLSPLGISATHDNVFKSRYTMISDANHKVRILSTNLATFFSSLSDDKEDNVYQLFKRKLERGCKFQIIIYMPGSPGIQEKQWEEDDYDLEEDIRHSWRRYLGPALAKYHKNLEIRFIKINPSFAATIIDEVTMFVSINVPGGSRRDRETPKFEIQSTDRLFGVFTDAFEKIWNDNKYVTSSVPEHLKSLLKEERIQDTIN